jgi:Mg2+/Co2+ transporter CorB
MSTIYRRTYREFFKVDKTTGITTRVLCKHLQWKIERDETKLTAHAVIEDDTFIPSTEEEFNSAYKEAMERIQSGRI